MGQLDWCMPEPRTAVAETRNFLGTRVASSPRRRDACGWLIFSLPTGMVNWLKRSAANFGAGEFGIMRVSAPLIVAAILSMAAITGASATMRISDDIGGRIGAYVDQYSAVKNSGERVVIDGACLSACTLVLGIVPRSRICVTRRATLGFHAAWMPGPNGKPVPSSVGTQALWDMYPQHVRQWINSRGGLSAKMMFLRGRELMSMYPEC